MFRYIELMLTKKKGKISRVIKMKIKYYVNLVQYNDQTWQRLRRKVN